MVKIVYILHRRDDVTPEDFYAYWKNDHGPLVRSFAKAIRAVRYVQSHTIPGAPSEMLRASRGAKPPYDGITEVWFDSLEALGASGEEGLAAARRLYEDEAEFIDFAHSAVFLTEEHEIF